MEREVGLRERKKQQTARSLWNAAMTLFTERGFDHVSIAEIAAAADVSKMTVFNYFPSKEDLVLKPLEEHLDEAAQVVRARRDGESPLSALLRHALDRIRAHDPMLGMNDDEQVLRVHRLVQDTPALLQRAATGLRQSEELLANELARNLQPILARIAAAEIIGVLAVLRQQNLQRLLAGEVVGTVESLAEVDARLAFSVLEHGLGAHLADIE